MEVAAGASRRLRVLHVIDGFGGHNFGDLLRCLAPEHDVHLAALTALDPELVASLEADGVKVVQQGPVRRTRYPQLGLRLVALIRRLRIDVLHTHLFDSSAVGMPAGWLAAAPARVVTRHHGDLHHRLGKPLHVAVDRLAARLAHRVIAVSEATRSLLVDREGVPADKVRVIHNGVDLSRFRPIADREARAFREEIGVPDGLLLTVPAQLREVKGHRHLLAALPAIREAVGDRVTLLLAGDGPLREELRGEARRLGLDGSVQLLGWRTDIERVLAASDIVVLPSLSETFGQVVVEAMAVGRPVVASRVGGVAAIVEDGANGLLTPPASAEGLAASVVRLVRDEALTESIRASACTRAGDFDVQRIAAAHDDLYREIR